MEREHNIPSKYLDEILNSQTKRHVSRIAGWLNNSHGNTRENRRKIQNTVKEWRSSHKNNV
jgi:hypothetical protein